MSKAIRLDPVIVLARVQDIEIANTVYELTCSTPRATRRVFVSDVTGKSRIKMEGFAKPCEIFQRLSPKAVVLPLHHSPPKALFAKFCNQSQELQTRRLGAPTTLPFRRQVVHLKSSSRRLEEQFEMVAGPRNQTSL